MNKTVILEKLKGIVERVTYHNEVNGWSVLRVKPFQGYQEIVTVTVHQTRVFAGATMEFQGSWTSHPRFGKQFKAVYATEIKPATTGALEKYLGSGLIKGVGPKTARKIVSHFQEQTLDVFENNIDLLLEVPGIAQKKLTSISVAWNEHRAVREVMMFLQSHNISTLFAVRIFKQYGDRAIEVVRADPYRLARDFFGIGFFTADKVALALGFAPSSPLRVRAGIQHVLSASRESGDCFLTGEQVAHRTAELLQLDVGSDIPEHLTVMEEQGSLKVRRLQLTTDGSAQECYYAKSIYYDEEYTAGRLRTWVGRHGEEETQIRQWVTTYTASIGLTLSDEQMNAVCSIADQKCSILTGGPGCGKTTVTRVIVALLKAMGRKILLAAPTGRAAQRMEEVVGLQAKTIHRLLEFQGTGFKRNEDYPLETDVLIVDECSMLDISLTASLLRAVKKDTSLLLIGDADQLPSVGAGNVLKDCISSDTIPCYALNTVFRQAAHSTIIKTAHAVNRGETPRLDSPFKKPGIWNSSDCFFIDSDEATLAQLRFIERVKQRYHNLEDRESIFTGELFTAEKSDMPTHYEDFTVPEKFSHVSPDELAVAESTADALLVLAKKTHPWSSLYYGLTALDVVLRLYSQWIPKYLGAKTEIQVLAPMIRGSLGTANLNTVLQRTVNPPADDRHELQVGERTFRTGDRVIHRRNNYDLNVFNGDIGRITFVDNSALGLEVLFESDGRRVEYSKEQVTELDLAYAVTVHKSQGSEFDAVILPVLGQHFKMLYRNLLYTGITRGKKLVVLVGTRRALAMTVRNRDTSLRQTALRHLLQSAG